MTNPQIRVMLDAEDFDHLIRGGELRVATEQGTACVAIADVGWDVMRSIIYDACIDRQTRPGVIREREARA